MTGEHEEIVAEKLEKSAEHDLISTGKAEALVAHAEDLLTQVSTLATKIQTQQDEPKALATTGQELHLNMPQNLQQFAYQAAYDQEEIHYH